MSIDKEIRIQEALRKFQGIESAYHLMSSPPLERTYIGDCILVDSHFEEELIALNTALLQLDRWRNYPRFEIILRSLFGQVPIQKAIKEWDQALSEILGLAYFEAQGILCHIGYPADLPGHHLPFDFALKIHEGLIPGDIKPANGSGFLLLETALRKCVLDMAASLGTTPPLIAIRYHGPLTQEVVGQELCRLTSQFKSRLANIHDWTPQVLELAIGLDRVTGPEAKVLSTKVYVFLGKVTVPGGGITGTSILSDVLATTFKKHIRHKGGQCKEEDPAFIITYVRLPGHGSSDIKNHVTFGDTVAKTIQMVGNSTPKWFGNLFLPTGSNVEKPRFYASNTGMCSSSISAASLSNQLGAMLTAVPTFREDICG